MTGPAPARTRLSQNDLRKALRPAGFRNEDDLRAEFPQLALSRSSLEPVPCRLSGANRASVQPRAYRSF